MAVVPTHVTPPIVPAKVPVADAPRPADPEPIAVVFLEEGSSGGGGSRGGRGTATTLAAASTGTAHGEETPAPARPVAPSPWMVMRHPDLKGPSEDFMRKFEENTRPIPVRPSVMGSKEKEDIAAISRKLNDPDYVEFADPTALGNLRILREQKREEVAAAELHPSGNGTYATCLSCGRRHELADIRTRFEATGSAPICEACGGMVKSATVS